MLAEIAAENRMRASVTDYLAGPVDHNKLGRLCVMYGEVDVMREIDSRQIPLDCYR